MAVETFRRADFTDLSLGLFRSGLAPTLVRRLPLAVPNAGFHRRLTQLAVRQAPIDPLHPLPMLR